ncbi:MAG: RNA polymerase sigma factor [Jatrophihabitantaceae bacterium]
MLAAELDRTCRPAPGRPVRPRLSTGVEIAAPRITDDDAQLVTRLRAGDSAAFREIVLAWSPVMVHVARTFVGSNATAEEVVQETWLAVIRGLDGFEGRSSLRTWAFRVLTNIARRQGVREHRVVVSSQFHDEDAGPTVPPDRFRPAGEQWAGGWRSDSAPRAWGPEAAALGGEVRRLLAAALAQLPSRQRAVIELRDVDGLSADEVCALLELSPANQRVLLHRARAKLREQLADYYSGRDSSGREANR